MDDRGNRGFFPDHLAKTGGKNDSGAAESRIDVVTLTTEESKYGAVETHEGSQALRGAVPLEGRADRRRDRHPANFGDGGPSPTPAAGAVRRSVLCSYSHTPVRWAQRTAATALRQDVRMQQSTPVQHPYSLTTLHTGSPDSASSQDWNGSPGLFRIVKACGTCLGASARGQGVQHRALQ